MRLFYSWLKILVGVILGVKYQDPYEDSPDWLTSAHGYFTGTVFFVLVVVLAYHGFKIYQLIRHVSRSIVLIPFRVQEASFWQKYR